MYVLLHNYFYKFVHKDIHVAIYLNAQKTKKTYTHKIVISSCTNSLIYRRQSYTYRPRINLRIHKAIYGGRANTYLEGNRWTRVDPSSRLIPSILGWSTGPVTGVICDGHSWRSSYVTVWLWTIHPSWEDLDKRAKLTITDYQAKLRFK